MNQSKRQWVIWGLKTQRHTHRDAHFHFYLSLKKSGRDVVWVDNADRNRSCIKPDSIVLTAGMACSKLPVVNRAKYCLHNCPEALENQIPRSNLLKLQVYTSTGLEGINGENWKRFVVFDKAKQTLYQPWGTNLEKEEFLPPVWKSRFKLVFWVGLVWNNSENQGNQSKIKELKECLKKKHIAFCAVHGIPDWMNTLLIRKSWIAPAIAGEWQSRNNYLPCRLFKNVSYGQLGISNVLAFKELFDNIPSINLDIPSAVDFALSLSETAWKRSILEQQEAVSGYTYRNSVINIERAFESLS